MLDARTRRVGLLIGALASATLVAAQDGPEHPTDAASEEAPVLARFLARPDEPVTRSCAIRRMEVRAVGQRAWMNVRVELDPARGFTWTIESEGGSKTLRERCLLRLLEVEAETHAAGAAPRAALTLANYLLEPAGRHGEGLVRLRAQARRRETALVDGFFLVTPDTADLVRVEGRLARGPSFWIPRAEITRTYARVQGHRVVVRFESLGHLRLLGESRLVVGYDYQMIDGQRIAPAPTLAMAGRIEP